MKTITPTPCQAAVVLRKYLAGQGVNLPLAKTQEATARMLGYADWQALSADIGGRSPLPVRGGTDLVGALELASAVAAASTGHRDGRTRKHIVLTDGPPTASAEQLDATLRALTGTLEEGRKSLERAYGTPAPRAGYVQADCTELAIRLMGAFSLDLGGRIVRIRPNPKPLWQFAASRMDGSFPSERIQDQVAVEFDEPDMPPLTIRDLMHCDAVRRNNLDTTIGFYVRRPQQAFLLDADAETAYVDKANGRTLLPAVMELSTGRKVTGVAYLDDGLGGHVSLDPMLERSKQEYEVIEAVTVRVRGAFKLLRETPAGYTLN